MSCPTSQQLLRLMGFVIFRQISSLPYIHLYALECKCALTPINSEISCRKGELIIVKELNGQF